MAHRRMGKTSRRDESSRLLEREVGYVRKPHAGRLRVALAFPNTYCVGMSNLGFQTVYRLFNDLDNVVCERVFLPGRSELAAALERPGSLTTMESGTLGAGLRRVRVLGLVRVGLHQPRQPPAPGRAAALRRGAERPSPARRHRRGGDLRQPRAAGAVRRRGGGRRGRSARARAHARRSAPRRIGTACSRRWPASAASTCPLSCTCGTARTGTIEAFEPAPGSGAAVPGAQSRARRVGRCGPALDGHLHPRHRIRLAPARGGRARVREPVPVLLGRLQLPARPGVSGRPDPGHRPGRPRARQPHRARLDRAVRSPRDRSAARASCSRWAIRSARRRFGSTT